MMLEKKEGVAIGAAAKHLIENPAGDNAICILRDKIALIAALGQRIRHVFFKKFY